MDPTDVLLWIKALLVMGFAAYLSLFVINNVTDPGTNSAAVGRMMSMQDLKDDPPLGRGVLWRAVDSAAVHRAAFRLVIAVQAGAAVVLWWATALLIHAGANGYSSGDVRPAVAIADVGLAIFVALWLGFILTGLWFSYWVKMGPVQQGHLIMLLASLGGVIVVNLGM